jgi:hypothetical protein
MIDDAAVYELGRVADRGPSERYGVAETVDLGPSDPRLARVWQQLMRRDRKTGGFFYPARLDLGCGTAEERQRFAIGMLLAAACEAPRPVVTSQERDSMREELRTAAAAVRVAVDHLQRLGLRPLHTLGDWPRLDPWIATGDDVEAKADDLDQTVLVVGRDRGMRFERAMAVWLATMCRLLFDKVLPGVVAALVEVVVGRPVNEWRILEWVKSADKE